MTRSQINYHWKQSDKFAFFIRVFDEIVSSKKKIARTKDWVWETEYHGYTENHTWQRHMIEKLHRIRKFFDPTKFSELNFSWLP